MKRNRFLLAGSVLLAATLGLGACAPSNTSTPPGQDGEDAGGEAPADDATAGDDVTLKVRSEEHTSELQSRGHLVCRLLLEKKKINAKKAATKQASTALPK